MKILCPQCFKQIYNVKKNIAICDCGYEYNLKSKSSLFRIRLDGGYVKEGISYSDIIETIKNGGILADEYIAAQNGPWITVYDSPLLKYIPKNNIKTKNGRTAIMLYKKKKHAKIFIVILSFLLLLSITVNGFLLLLMEKMQLRIEELVLKITGG